MIRHLQQMEVVEAYSDPLNPWIKLFFDHVRFSDGREGRYNRIVENDGRHGVAILPIHDGRIGLVRQYRYPIDRDVWEIPRGFGETASPETDARRELAEETGIENCDLVSLGTLHPNSGLLTSEIHVFAAMVRDATAGHASRGDKEIEEFRWFPVAKVLEMIETDEITDAFTLAAVLRAGRRGLS